jgi:hypothetical protein
MRAATALALLFLGTLACGGGAPPDLPLPAWIEEAEDATPRWQAAEVWCDRRPDHARCQPVLRAKGELVLRKLLRAAPPPEYDEGNHLPVVPQGVEEVAP